MREEKDQQAAQIARFALGTFVSAVVGGGSFGNGENPAIIPLASVEKTPIL